MLKSLIIGCLVLLASYVYPQSTDFKEETSAYTITTIKAATATFPNYFQYQTQIDSISENHEKWAERADAIERFLIDKSATPIKIEGFSRIIRLKNGKEQKLHPVDSLGELQYTYLKEFPEANLLLFSAILSEGNTYFVVNTQTGEKTYTIGLVFLNQDNSLLMSINDDVDAETSYNGFQLFQIKEDGALTEAWKYSPFWAPDQAKWIDRSTLIVYGYYYDEERDMERQRFYKQLNITEKELDHEGLLGDFDGDGEQEVLTDQLISLKNNKPIDFTEYGDVTYDSLVSIAVSLKPKLSLVCTNPNIDELFLSENPQTFGISWLKNIGDINQDGRDEISVVIKWADWSSINTCMIYSFTTKGWEKLSMFEIREWQMRWEEGERPFQGFIEQDQSGIWYVNTYTVEEGVIKRKLNIKK